MPIDFTCSGCSKQLRVSDESAGKDARCPECGSINRVPSATFAAYPPASTPAPPPAWQFSEGGAAPASNNPFGAGAAPNPYAAPNAGAYASPATAPIQPTVVSLEPILNHAWAVWKDNLGILVGMTVVVAVIQWIVSFSLQMGQFAVIQNGGEDAALLMAIPAWFLEQAVQVFFMIGQFTIMLKLARRQPADFGELFSGSATFLPTYVVFLLFVIAVGVGMVLLIVPGVLLALMLWPALYLSAEGKAGIGESFTLASQITKGNWGTGFLIFLLGIAIMIVGLLALCVGVLFAAPLVGMLWATAYLMMSGQLPVYSQQPQYPAYGK